MGQVNIKEIVDFIIKGDCRDVLIRSNGGEWREPLIEIEEEN